MRAIQRGTRWEKPCIIRMTRHFVTRWQERVGGDLPSLQEVNEILASAQRIRRQTRCMVRRGGALVPHKILAEYWDHARGMVLLVDEDRGAAVTVITADHASEGDARW